MKFNPLPLIGDDFIDTEIINVLIENDLYLKDISPNIELITPGGSFSTASGHHVRMRAGTINIRKFTGTITFSIKFPGIANGPPSLLLTPYLGGAAGMAYIVKWHTGYTGADVRITLVNGKNTVAAGRLCYMLVYKPA